MPDPIHFTPVIHHRGTIRNGSSRVATKLVRSGPHQVKVVLTKEWVDEICSDPNTKLEIGFSASKHILITPEEVFRGRGSKVLRNKCGSAYFMKALHDDLMAVLFPSDDIKVVVPQEIGVVEHNGVKCLAIRCGDNAKWDDLLHAQFGSMGDSIDQSSVNEGVGGTVSPADHGGPVVEYSVGESEISEPS
jgi:hypothetical protein